MDNQFLINEETAKNWTENKIREYLKKTQIIIKETTNIDEQLILKIYNDSILDFDYKKRSGKFYSIIKHIKENGQSKNFLETFLLKVTNDYLKKLHIKAIKKYRLEEIKKILKKWFNENPEKWLRTSITKKLLEDNLKIDYTQVATRHSVYSIMAKIRKELRNKKFKEGYLISGTSILKNFDLDHFDEQKYEKIDGWFFTKNKDKIEEYLNDVIRQAKKIIQNYTKFKNVLEENKTSDYNK